MRLSTKGRYGTRLMLELALNYSNRPVLLSEVAKRQEISVKYLEQLVRPLKIAGLIQSVRGARGGYMLTRPPSKITLKEIITVLEGQLSLVECVFSGNCSRWVWCVTKDIWKEISKKVIDFLSEITLQDMVHRYRKKEHRNQKILMYNI